MTTKDIENLKTNEAVVAARDEVASTAPKNYYSFERDFKSLKADQAKLLTFLTNIPAESYGNIFKNDLEPDVLLEILKCFSAQSDEYLKEKQGYLVQVALHLSAVAPFALACDFMMDDEKAVLRDFVVKLDAAGVDVSKVKSGFKKGCSDLEW